MVWCRDVHELSNKTISTYLSYYKAGCNFAARPLIVEDARGLKREVRLLDTVPYIEDGEAKIAEHTGLPRSQPRGWVPTDAELAAIIDGFPQGREYEAAFRYMIMALNTWARPEAVLDLSVQKQVDFENGLVHLNPPGRAQNKKRRPPVRLTDNLRGWLLHWNVDRPLMYFGRVVKKVDARTLKRAAQRAIDAGRLPANFDLRNVNRYMLRHYMSTRVRRVDTVQVTREDRAKWLGHKDAQHSMTETFYESFDPDHLEEAKQATDAVLQRLGQLMQVRTVIPPNAAADSKLTVLRNDNDKRSA
jgi:hypothetical protein